MNGTQATEDYYTLKHLCMFTGLSDRTLRNYISSGFLQGEKINGLWYFTPEQAEAFVAHPAVRPAILAKRNGVVYDFLAEDKKKEEQVCLILDFPGVDRRELAEFFCCAISNGDFRDFRFSLDGNRAAPRVILKGPTAQVLGLVNRWYGRKTEA